MGNARLINIAASSSQSNSRWRCLVEHCMAYKARLYDPYHVGQVLPEMLEAALWIMEVWNSELTDPVGFRNACGLAGSSRILLVFNKRPDEDFPTEGPFWITYAFTESIKDKIDSMLSQPPIEKAQFEELLKKYPDLGRKPERSHHH